MTKDIMVELDQLDKLDIARTYLVDYDRGIALVELENPQNDSVGFVG